MIESEFVQVLGNFGFPVALVIYLLFRFEKRIDKLRESIDKLSEIINDMNRK